MATVYHDINATWFQPPAARLEIDADGQLTVHAGYWPDVGEAFVELEDARLLLTDGDQVVLLARADVGDRSRPGIAVSEHMQPYGLQPVAGGYELQPHVDLLAWREGETWHIKRLVQ